MFSLLVFLLFYSLPNLIDLIVVLFESVQNKSTTIDKAYYRTTN